MLLVVAVLALAVALALLVVVLLLLLVRFGLVLEVFEVEERARTLFAAERWAEVEPVAAQGSLVEISGRGRTVQVGRFLRPELRSPFARELRQALRLVPPVHPVEDGTTPNTN